MNWEVLNKLEEVALEHNFKLKKEAATLSRMNVLLSKFGKLICPCTFIPEKPIISNLTECPCDDSHEDVHHNGKCHCGIFERKEEL